MNSTPDYDAIILGAGFAGLSAADTLLSAGQRVLLIEARNRVGGRARTDTLADGTWVDMGGQWLGPGQQQMYALAERFAVTTWPMHVAGHNLLQLGKKQRRYRGLIPKTLSPTALFSLGKAFWQLEKLARTVPLESPWLAPQAEILDSQTLAQWLQRQVRHRDARIIIEAAINAVFAADPTEISLLHALFYLHSGGGLESLTRARGGAQQDRLHGGSQRLAEALANDLQQRGATLWLEYPAQHVIQEQQGVTVRGQDWQAHGRQLICTLPPALVGKLDWQPPLPDDRQQWCLGLPPGQVIKCHAIYSQPFWRQQGLSGSAAGDLKPVSVCFDATPPDSNKGILLGFIEGHQARHWRQQSTAARREAVLDCFARYFGATALAPLDYLDLCWEDEAYSGGCYAGVARPGVQSRVGHSVRRRHGRVHWAGSETASHWNGYLEGAVRSGQRAAGDLLACAD